MIGSVLRVTDHCGLRCPFHPRGLSVFSFAILCVVVAAVSVAVVVAVVLTVVLFALPFAC